MTTTKKTKQGPRAKGHTARIGETEAGSIRIRFADIGGRTLLDERLLSAKMFEVAAVLERRAGFRDYRWPVSVRTGDRIIDVELSDGDQVKDIRDLIDEVLIGCGLLVVA